MMTNGQSTLLRSARGLLIWSVFSLLAFSEAAWSAVAFVNAQSASPGVTNSLSIGTTNPAAGQIMLAQVSVRGGSAIAITAPAGWTLINRTNNSTTLAQALYYRLSGGSEPSSYTWTFNASNYAAGGILVFSGVDTANPVDVWSSRSNGSSNNVTANGVTTTVGNAMLVGLITNADGRSNFKPPTGMTERYDTQSGSGQDNAVAISTFDAVQVVAGASGDKVATATASVVSVAHLVALRPAATTAVTPGGFNAFESGTPLGSTSGVIRTHIAASAFGLDVAALKTGGTAIETAFAGDVRLELVDASSAASCSAYALIRDLGTLAFVAADQGRKTFSGISEPNAWPNARIRMTYPATGTATVIACSTDNFAIRPASLAGVSVTDSDWQTSGTSRALANIIASGGNVHKAGRPFTLRATAHNASGAVTGNYSGSPTLKTLACTLPAPTCVNGSLTPGAWSGSGTVTSSSASYSEAGSFNLTLEDRTFTDVDSADSTLLERTIPQDAAVPVGRFVPDHFQLAESSTPAFVTFNDTTCGSRSFTYVGQPFGYLTLPQATITAKNADGAATLNYTGALWKLASAGVVQTYMAATGILDTGLVGTPVVAATGSGSGTLTANAADAIAFVRGTPIVPFAAEISLSMSIQDSSENAVTGNGLIDASPPALFSNIAFDAGNEIRFGRLVLTNAHGSELLGLPVPIETQFWNGSGFVRNMADDCTRLSANQVALSNWRRDLAACETSVSLSGRFIDGRGNLRFSAPGAGNTGSVDLTVHLGASGSGSTCVGGAATSAVGAAQTWLQGRWTAGAYDQNPAARASFGLYRGSKPLIYLRELY